MTEAEWLVCEDASGMLAFLRTRASQRKLRLFAVACCQHISDMITDDRSRRGLTVAERFADGLATQGERREWYHTLRSFADDFPPDECVASALYRHAYIAASGGGDFASLAEGVAADYASSASNRIPIIERARGSERRRQGQSLREIFGNPFRPVVFSPLWRTDTALSLARGMYDSRDFGAMPILADALQDAGCDNADVLNHCRGEGPHVRGCWVVDSVLGL